MAIDIGRLESVLVEMSIEGAPGRDFCEAISELAATGRFSELRDMVPAVVFAELKERYERDPTEFIGSWRMLAEEMSHGFVEHARHRLTSLTRLQAAGEPELLPVWQKIQRALDGQQNELLRAAFALELLELVEPAVSRATHLRECVVASQVQRRPTGTWTKLPDVTSSGCSRPARS